MTEFYVPVTKAVTIPGTKRTIKLWRGIHDALPAELVDSHFANDLGIKPVSEMTDAEWRMIGRKKPEPVEVAEPAHG